MTKPRPNPSAPASDALLAAIVESSGDAIISKDLNSIVTTWNPAAERMFGYTEAEAVGRSITMIFPPDRVDEELMILDRIKRGERLAHYETVRRHKDGTLIEVSATVSPIKDAQGQIVGASKILRDVREQRRAERRLAVTLSSIGDAVISTDVAGLIVFMNAVAEELTGWTEKEAIGRPLTTVFNIVNETSRQTVESPVDKVIRSGAIEGLANHTILIARNGVETAIDDSAAPIKDVGGVLMGVVLVFRNVTERRTAHLAALRLAAIVEGSDDAIIGKNLRSIVTSWNHGAERIFGYSAEEMIGQSITLLIPPARLSEEQDILARLQRGEQVQHFETVRVRKDGREIHVSLTISPIRDEHGDIIGASKIARDVTAQKDAERALQQAQGQLKLHAQNLEREVRERTARLHEMVAELDSFSYSLSHDLRAPLRAIQGFSEIVLNDYSEKIPEGVDYLRRIVKAAARMDRLIQDVLAFSRVSRAEISVRTVDLEKLVTTIVHDRPELQPPRANVVVQQPLLPVVGHEASLTQVIANLLDNAVKFVPAGVTPQVRLTTTRAEGNKVRFAVTDNGIGIDPAVQPRLFKMFERLATDRVYEGTGIGLAIVRKAAERMNGRAGVESKPGEGSTFWIELPGANGTKG
jgi:PAS domain S-box-containing protein